MINWKNILLPYRLLLKKTNKNEIQIIVKECLPKPYNPSLLIPVYREKISNYNKQGDELSNTKELNKLEDAFKGVNSDFIKNETSFIAASEAFIFLGADAFNGYQAVDEYVYEGMSRLSGDNLDSLADLSSKVQSYDHDFWGGLTDAGVNKVGGHVGEAFAADSLTDKGMDVQWPEASNQEGWDLLINGHEANVKIVADANQLTSHFNEYPDIPAIIPGDTANIPESAIYLDSDAGMEELNQALNDGVENLVVVDPSISGNEIMNQTEQATDFLSGSTDIFDSYVPVATAAFSLTREFKLLSKGVTTLADSAINASLDLAGTGLGGFGGAKIGATIGSFITPGIGSAIGGVLGGIAGAIFGRKGTDKIKNANFEKALEEYKKNERKFQFDKNRILLELDKNINDKKESEKNTLLIEKIKAKKEIETATNLLLEYRKQMHTISGVKLLPVKNNAISEIEDFELKLNLEYKNRNKIIALFWPNAKDFAYEQAKVSFQEMKEKIDALNVNRHSHDGIKLVNDFSKMGIQKQFITDFLLKEENLRVNNENEYRYKINLIRKTMVNKRHRAMNAISEYVTSETNKAKNNLKDKVSFVIKSLNKVNSEKAKLGL